MVVISRNGVNGNPRKAFKTGVYTVGRSAIGLLIGVQRGVILNGRDSCIGFSAKYRSKEGTET